MNVKFYLFELWGWLVEHGLPIVALILIGMLIPRIGRLAVRLITRRLAEDEESTKTRLALVGALVYVGEAVAFFFITLMLLTNLGVPALGAALPATVVSAAIGFGAQKVIGDFLSGFFIISERQFGLGDYVSFDGGNSPVEGTVVALTLRATRLRTPSGEMVNVPNGSTGVITNFSQEWSRAVVDIQVPMESGESMAVLTKSVEEAARRAINDPTVSKDITGELDVLPAMELVQPVAAGQPWAVKFRITVDVNPARQWAVERAIRASLANVFWHRMQNTGAFGPVEADEPPIHPPATHETVGETALGSDSTDDGPGAPSTPQAALAASQLDDTTAETKPQYDTRINHVLSFGNRVRVSTTLLMLGLLLVAGLGLLASNPEGGDAGVLNPNHWRNTEKAVSEAPSVTHAPAPQPTTSATPTTEDYTPPQRSTPETEYSETPQVTPTNEPSSSPSPSTNPSTQPTSTPTSTN